MKITIEGPQGCGKGIIADIIGRILMELEAKEPVIVDESIRRAPAKLDVSEDEFNRIFGNQEILIEIVHTFIDEKTDSSRQLAGCETELATEQSAIPSEELHGHALDTNQSQSNSSEETRRTVGSSSCRLGRPQDLHADNISS